MKTCWVCGGELPNRIIENLGKPISELGFSNRAFNCLSRVSIDYVEQLIKLTEYELKRIRNVGPKTHKEIIEKIKLLKDSHR